MTRDEAAKKLLEHGPLTFRELREITGWPGRSADQAIVRLMALGVVVAEHQRGVNRNVYRLA